jgi:hypothetical protein
MRGHQVAEMRHRAQGCHAAGLHRGDVLTVIFPREAFCRELTAGHAPQQQAAHGPRITQRKGQRHPAAGGTAPNKCWQGIELFE